MVTPMSLLCIKLNLYHLASLVLIQTRLKGYGKISKVFTKKLNIKTKYIIAISHFYFHKELSQKGQFQFLSEGLNDLHLPDYEGFEDTVFNNLYPNFLLICE